jgi:hypothetical protein
MDKITKKKSLFFVVSPEKVSVFSPFSKKTKLALGETNFVQTNEGSTRKFEKA